MFAALGVLHSSQKQAFGINLIARCGDLGGMIRIHLPSGAMRPPSRFLDAVASRGNSTQLLGATCGLSQVAFVEIKGLALQKAGMLGARLALHISSAQQRAIYNRACFRLVVGFPIFIPQSTAVANSKSNSKLICGAHCTPSFTATP